MPKFRLIAVLSLCIYSLDCFCARFNCDAIFKLANARATFDIELERIRAAKEKEISQAVLECPKYDFQACVGNRLRDQVDINNKTNSDFLDKFFTNSCLKSGMGSKALAQKALSSYALTAGITLTSTLGGYFSTAATTGNNRLPIAYLTTSQLFLLIGSELACRNMARSQGAPVSNKRVLWENYKSYMVMNLISNMVYMSFMMTEDHIRGDVERSFDSYLKEAGVSMAWDSVFSAAHAFYLDKVLIQQLPQLRDFINQGVKNRFFASAGWEKVGKEWVFKVAKAPGYGTEITLRWLYSYLRSYAWQRVSVSLKSEDPQK